MSAGVFERRPGLEPVVQRAEAAHRRAFGREPTVFGAGPGRVNLIGEHTDYSGGLVMPLAIDRWCVAAASPSAGRTTRVFASDADEHSELETGRPLAPEAFLGREPAWVRYVAGVIEQVRRAAAHRGGGDSSPALDITIAGSVPRGAGLASSAAIELAVASAVSSLRRLGASPLELARMGRRTEHEFAGVPCGIMDQFASAMGRQGSALLIDCRDETATPVPLPAPDGPDGAAVMVVNTNVKHALPDGAYGAKVRACEAAAKKLGVPTLREATAEIVGAAENLSDEERRAAEHVVAENGRVVTFGETLAAAHAGEKAWPDALDRLGWQLMESHSSLRHGYQVSCMELDVLVELATMTPGVYGSRMTGAGFGGSIVALVRPDCVEAFSASMARGYLKKTGLECTVDRVEAVEGCCAFDA